MFTTAMLVVLHVECYIYINIIQLKLEEMMESYDDTSDFAVVLQPFFKNVKIPAEASAIHTQ